MDIAQSERLVAITSKQQDGACLKKKITMLERVASRRRSRIVAHVYLPGTSTVSLSFNMPIFHVEGPVFSISESELPLKKRPRRNRPRCGLSSEAMMKDGGVLCRLLR